MNIAEKIHKEIEGLGIEQSLEWIADQFPGKVVFSTSF